MLRISKIYPYLTPTLVFFISLGVLSYMYFLSLSVVHVVMRKEAIQDMVELRSQIARLESNYIEARHTISSQLATRADFNQIQDKIFINRTEPSLVLRTGDVQ